MMSYLDKMADAVYEHQMMTFEPVFADIEQKLFDIAAHDSAHESHPLHKLKEKLAERLKVLTLCGFNCGKYDLNLVRTYLFKWLKQKGYQPSVIKRDNSYLLLATSKFRVLDISNFIAAGHSYESYLRAYEVEESKGCFPYEWFDSAEKLEHTTLPPHKAFYSTLKAQNINAEKYQECLAVWKKEHMNTFRDFLVYYNNKDVIGFLRALKKQNAFFQRQRNDVFG